MRVAIFGLVVMLALPGTASAQQTKSRVRAYVDYIAGRSLYLSAGQQQGLFEADTVDVYRENATTPSGRLIVVSSTRTRAVATFAGEPFAVARGDVLLLEPGAAALARLELLQVQRDSAAHAVPAAPPEKMAIARARARGVPQINGRIGIDLDAFQNMTQWGTEPDQRNETTYATPTVRVYLTTTDLPGGVQLTANLRASYYGNSAANERRMAMQAYEVSVNTDFDGSPIQLRVGRFYNPFESHSGYWDGGLIRIGPRGIGVGVAAGYEPLYANQAFSTTTPKTTFFIDAHKRSGQVRYDGDLSVHRQTQQLVGGQREYAGLSQRLSIGRIYITQRLQIGRDSADRPQIWQLQLSASAPVAGPLQLNARYSSDRNDLYLIGPQPGGTRVRRTVGVAVAGSAGYASIDAGDVDYGAGRRGRTISLNSAVPRVLAGFGWMLSGTHSSESSFSSSYASSSLDHNIGRALLRAGVRYYRTDFGASLFEQRGSELSLVLPLPDRSELTFTASSNRGDNNYSNRMLISIWKSF